MWKTYDFSKYALPIVFVRDIQDSKLTFERADNEQGRVVNALKGIDKGVKPVEKRSFLNNIGLSLCAREKSIDNFKSRIFPIKYKTPTPEHESATEYKRIWYT